MYVEALYPGAEEDASREDCRAFAVWMANYYHCY